MYLFLVSFVTLPPQEAPQLNIGSSRLRALIIHISLFSPGGGEERLTAQRRIYAVTPLRAAYELCSTHAPRTIKPRQFPTMPRFIRGEKENPPVRRRRGLTGGIHWSWVRVSPHSESIDRQARETDSAGPSKSGHTASLRIHIRGYRVT